MADNKIEIIASLDIPKSKHNIVGEIKQLQADLQADDNARPKLIAGLDIDKSKTLIQSQLNTIVNQANAPTIKVGIDVSNTKNISTAINEQLGKTNVADRITNSFNKTIDVIKKAEQEYRELFNVTKQGDVTGIWNKDTNGNINGFTVNVKKAKGETESFRYVLKQVGEEMQFVYAGGRGSDSGVYKLTTDIENARAKYSRLLADFKSSNNAILSGLSTPIQQFETSLNNLGKTSSINDVKNSFEALKQSASQISMYLDTTNSAFNKNTNAINHYKSMDNILKEISATFDNLAIKPNVLKNELDGVKTKFAELQTLEKTEGGYTETWAKKYQEVNLELAKVKANIQSIAKSEAKTLADLQKSITTAIGNLDSKKLNSTFTRNNTNPEVVQQIAKIDELKAKYQNLLNLISQPQTPESLTKLRNETLLLDRDYQLLIQSVKNFQGTLRNDKVIDVNANKIKQLRAEIQAYMNLNPKAMNMKLSGGNTVGVELNRMLSQLNDLASPELVASIERQFTTIEKTVVSMGKEGNTAFGSLLASAKKFGTWMGITGFISGFIRNIRKMITNVIELDTAMTNLKKVTDETTATYSKFFDSATERAKKLHTAVSDLIEQTAMWAKLGYGLKDAQKLAETSTIYAKVGEVDNETAVSDLVTVMKANLMPLCTEMYI